MSAALRALARRLPCSGRRLLSKRDWEADFQREAAARHRAMTGEDLSPAARRARIEQTTADAPIIGRQRCAAVAVELERLYRWSDARPVQPRSAPT